MNATTNDIEATARSINDILLSIEVISLSILDTVITFRFFPNSADNSEDTPVTADALVAETRIPLYFPVSFVNNIPPDNGIKTEVSGFINKPCPKFL